MAQRGYTRGTKARIVACGGVSGGIGAGAGPFVVFYIIRSSNVFWDFLLSELFTVILAGTVMGLFWLALRSFGLIREVDN